MHPFIMVTSSSSACTLVFLASSASSMPTSPNSFSITAIFLPCVAREDVVEKRRLAAAQKAGEHGHRYL